jgi:hypothetical protein
MLKSDSMTYFTYEGIPVLFLPRYYDECFYKKNFNLRALFLGTIMRRQKYLIRYHVWIVALPYKSGS